MPRLKIKKGPFMNILIITIKYYENSSDQKKNQKTFVSKVH